MALTYQHIDEEDKAAVQADVNERDAGPTNTIDDATIAAWERDHYAHSLLLANETDPEQRKIHEEAMRTIEDAHARVRPPARR